MPHGAALRTKIVATLGPSSESAEVVERMARAGMTVARINFAHGTPQSQTRAVETVRAASRRVGRPLAVMADLAGPKIRIGDLAGGKVVLEPGQRVFLTTETVLGDQTRISVSEPRLLEDVRHGEPVFLADGTLELRAGRVEGNDLDCEVITGGLLLPQKGVNLPGTRLRVPGLTPKDRVDLELAKRIGVDAIALSFVRTVADVERARRIIGASHIPLVAKIEKREALENLEGIMDAVDGVMVARGDLGVEASIEEVPLLQKRIIRLANEQGKPVITATQMLLSMVEAPRPTRAEAADVANAILDGTDAVMLSEETARGRHPVRVVEMMARIATRAEAVLDPEDFAHRTRRTSWVAGAVSEAAVQVARQVDAKAIVTPTFAGATPRFVARLRPRVPILALTENPMTAKFLCLSWGVHPVHRRHLGGFESALRIASEELRRNKFVGPGDRFVVTAGYPRKHSSNLMTVQIQPGRTHKPHLGR